MQLEVGRGSLSPLSSLGRLEGLLSHQPRPAVRDSCPTSRGQQ